MLEKMRRKEWYPLAAALCVTVLFWFILNHLGVVWKLIGDIGYFLYPLVAGAVLAYLINPLMRFLELRVFYKDKRISARKSLSLILSFIIVVLILDLLIGILIPQLSQSISSLFTNRDRYFDELSSWIEKVGATSILKHFEGLFSSSQSLLQTVSDYISENGEAIETKLSKAGTHFTSWLIGVVFSVYFLAEKDKIRSGGTKLLHLIQKDQKKYERISTNLKRVDSILSKYLVLNIIDGFIIGAANAIFMLIAGMQYSGLVSVIVGVTNLITTFGPLIGAAFGGLILLLTNPLHALYFLIFTAVIQLADGWVLKPKLFGDSFGVSGLWILAGIIVGGRIFGMLGILLAIPAVAILDYMIKNALSASNNLQVAENQEAETNEI